MQTNTLSKIATIIGFSLFLMGFILGLGYVVMQVKNTYASVSVTDEYMSTTTSQMFGDVVNPVKQQRQIVANRPATLGSVTIASTSPSVNNAGGGVFKIWNATSTTDSASTTVARFATSTTAGTYTYDVRLERGLILEFPAGFMGEYTVTYRNN